MARLSEEQIERWLELVSRGMDPTEASYAVGDVPSAFQRLAFTDDEFFNRKVKAQQDARTRRNRTVNPELKAQFLDLVAGGKLPGEAARELGFFVKQFRQALDPFHENYDRDFQIAYRKAEEEGHPNFIQRLFGMAIQQAEAGSYPALRDLLIVHSDEYRRALSTKRVEVGSIDSDAFLNAALQVTSKLSPAEVEVWNRLLEKAISEGEEIVEADAEEEEPMQLVSGDGT